MSDMEESGYETQPTSSSSTSFKVNCKKRKKPYKTTSFVWDHFTKELLADGSYMKATCNYCHRPYNCPSSHGTTTLKRHLSRCCDYPYNKDKVGKFSASTQNQDPNWTFDQDVLRKELARMIIVDGLPFSFVEKEGFKRFMSYAEPRFHMISRTTITKDCIELYLSERKKLKTLFELSASRVCLTTDLWTSIQNLGYICLTAHFIDRDWKLHKKIINFCVLPTPHRGEAIAQAVDTCLLSWGLEKVCTITVDNASSNDTAATKLAHKLNKRNGLLLNGELFHVRCFAHILNLIVNDGINEVKKSILRIREFVKYVRSSPSRLQAFKKCVEEERIWSLKSLCLDVPTRWNSTYLMLKSAIGFQKALERLAEQNPSLGLHLVEQDTSLEVSKEPMSEEDWLKIRDLSKFLEYFYNVTKRISGSKYITCNKYFREVFGVQTVLLRWTKSEDLRFRDMAIKMNAKFEKYCNIRKLNLILVIAVVLDPCFKMKYVKFCYKKLYSSEEVDEIIGKVKSLMERLFRHYKLLEITSPTSLGAHLAQNLEDVYVPNEKEDGLEDDRDWKIFLREEENEVAKSELDRYLEDGVEEDQSNFDILSWWKGKSSTYRVLSLMARDILAIPLSTVASESAFSTGGRLLDKFRSSLTPKIVESLICAQDWLRVSPNPVEIEETLEALEVVEQGIAGGFEG